MTKPYHRTAYCSCGTQFQAKDRWQRSCEKCLEARAAAEAAKTPQACIRCGAQRDVTGRLCPSCRAAKQAKERAESIRREQRMMARFGPCPYHPDQPATHDGKCLKCHQEAIRDKRKDDYTRKLEAKRAKNGDDYEQRKEAYMRRFAQAPAEEQWQHVFVALGWVINVLLREGGAPPPVEPEEVHPEQVSADDQAVIDEAFRGIMEGIDL